MAPNYRLCGCPQGFDQASPFATPNTDEDGVIGGRYQLHIPIDRGAMATIERTVIIVHDVALGLGVALRRGIVHRNVKPRNVLAGRGRSIKLTDFSIARDAIAW
jgi:hypothetical protein